MPTKPTFVLLPRNPQGGLTRDGLQQAKELVPGGFEFQRGRKSERKILQELQKTLPQNVLAPQGNPFVVLKITRVTHVSPRGCLCQCGQARNCSGGGGGQVQQ
jgi:hypothetical protein